MKSNSANNIEQGKRKYESEVQSIAKPSKRMSISTDEEGLTNKEKEVHHLIDSLGDIIKSNSIRDKRRNLEGRTPFIDQESVLRLKNKFDTLKIEVYDLKERLEDEAARNLKLNIQCKASAVDLEVSNKNVTVLERRLKMQLEQHKEAVDSLQKKYDDECRHKKSVLSQYCAIIKEKRAALEEVTKLREMLSEVNADQLAESVGKCEELEQQLRVAQREKEYFYDAFNTCKEKSLALMDMASALKTERSALESEVAQLKEQFAAQETSHSTARLSLNDEINILRAALNKAESAAKDKEIECLQLKLQLRSSPEQTTPAVEHRSHKSPVIKDPFTTAAQFSVTFDSAPPYSDSDSDSDSIPGLAEESEESEYSDSNSVADREGHTDEFGRNIHHVREHRTVLLTEPSSYTNDGLSQPRGTSVMPAPIATQESQFFHDFQSVHITNVVKSTPQSEITAILSAANCTFTKITELPQNAVYKAYKVDFVDPNHAARALCRLAVTSLKGVDIHCTRYTEPERGEIVYLKHLAEGQYRLSKNETLIELVRYGDIKAMDEVEEGIYQVAFCNRESATLARANLHTTVINNHAMICMNKLERIKKFVYSEPATTRVVLQESEFTPDEKVPFRPRVREADPAGGSIRWCKYCASKASDQRIIRSHYTEDCRFHKMSARSVHTASNKTTAPPPRPALQKGPNRRNSSPERPLSKGANKPNTTSTVSTNSRSVSSARPRGNDSDDRRVPPAPAASAPATGNTSNTLDTILDPITGIRPLMSKR